jgi:phosphoribosylglycinamide formyltransferase-1
MVKTKIAVFVSGGGTNLQALIDAENSGVIHSGEITLVISNKEGVYALERAKSANIKTETILRKDYENQLAFEEKLISVLKENEIDIVVLAGFLSILSEKFTSEYKDKIINVHPSLIPSFCGKGFYGLKVHEEALKYGVKVTGATVHFVNEIPDGGKIILQKAVEIKDDDTPQTLQKRVMEEAEWILLPKAVEIVSKEIKIKKEKQI